MKDVKLPDKPSELIRVALADLEKCERSKKYEIEMDDWHVPKDNGVCAVCLGGAVMAKTCKLPDSKSISWECDDLSGFSPAQQSMFYALDSFRMGDIESALTELGLSRQFLQCGLERIRKVTPYDDDQTQFKADMRKLADDLEAAGL